MTNNIFEKLGVKPREAFSKQVGGDHYRDCPIQPVDYIEANNLGWCEGNAVKYVTRHKKKGGRESLLKAIHYLEMLIEREYPDSS